SSRSRLQSYVAARRDPRCSCDIQRGYGPVDLIRTGRQSRMEAVLKGATGGVDNSLMPDLWKALGDVYGEGGTDAPPVRREPAASERAAEAGARFGTALPLDDDLAAALSAALVNAPAPGPDAVAAESGTTFAG